MFGATRRETPGRLRFGGAGLCSARRATALGAGRAAPRNWHEVQGIESAPTYSLVGDVYAILLGGSDTGGAFSLVHAIVPPGGGPPMHTHSREDETFYVLEGEVTVFRDGREIVGGAGATVHLERGVAHRFQNCSDRPARMLIHVAPSGFERMVMEAGVAIEAGSTEPLAAQEGDIPRLLAACERAGIAIHT